MHLSVVYQTATFSPPRQDATARIVAFNLLRVNRLPGHQAAEAAQPLNLTHSLKSANPLADETYIEKSIRPVAKKASVMNALPVKSLLAMLTIAISLPAVGCTLPNLTLPGAAMAGPQKPDPEANFRNTPHYRISLYTESAKPQQSTYPLTGPKFASAALKEVDALSHFTKPRVYLMRTSESGQRHRMEMDYNPSRGNLHHAFDYSLRPDDHIIVTEDHRNESDSLLGQLLPGF